MDLVPIWLERLNVNVCEDDVLKEIASVIGIPTITEQTIKDGINMVERRHIFTNVKGESVRQLCTTICSIFGSAVPHSGIRKFKEKTHTQILDAFAKALEEAEICWPEDITYYTLDRLGQVDIESFVYMMLGLTLELKTKEGFPFLTEACRVIKWAVEKEELNITSMWEYKMAPSQVVSHYYLVARRVIYIDNSFVLPQEYNEKLYWDGLRGDVLYWAQLNKIQWLLGINTEVALDYRWYSKEVRVFPDYIKRFIPRGASGFDGYKQLLNGSLRSAYSERYTLNYAYTLLGAAVSFTAMHNKLAIYTILAPTLNYIINVLHLRVHVSDMLLVREVSICDCSHLMKTGMLYFDIVEFDEN